MNDASNDNLIVSNDEMTLDCSNDETPQTDQQCTEIISELKVELVISSDVVNNNENEDKLSTVEGRVDAEDISTDCNENEDDNLLEIQKYRSRFIKKESGSKFDGFKTRLGSLTRSFRRRNVAKEDETKVDDSNELNETKESVFNETTEAQSVLNSSEEVIDAPKISESKKYVKFSNADVKHEYVTFYKSPALIIIQEYIQRCSALQTNPISEIIDTLMPYGEGYPGIIGQLLLREKHFTECESALAMEPILQSLCVKMIDFTKCTFEVRSLCTLNNYFNIFRTVKKVKFSQCVFLGIETWLQFIHYITVSCMLNSVDISGIHFRDSCFNMFVRSNDNKVSGLYRLTAIGTKFSSNSNELLYSLLQNRHLRKIVLHSNKFTQRDIKRICKLLPLLHYLNTVNIYEIKLKKENIKDIFESGQNTFYNLSKILLVDAGIDQEGFTIIFSLIGQRKVTYIDFSENVDLDVQQMIKLLEPCCLKYLRHLHLRNTRLINFRDIAALFSNTMALQCLDLRKNVLAMDDLLFLQTQLENLEISQNFKLFLNFSDLEPTNLQFLMKLAKDEHVKHGISTKEETVKSNNTNDDIGEISNIENIDESEDSSDDAALFPDLQVANDDESNNDTFKRLRNNKKFKGMVNVLSALSRKKRVY